MASKAIKIFTCSKCGAQSPKWSGRCLECGAWASLEEEIVSASANKQELEIKATPAKIYDFNDIKEVTNVNRYLVGTPEIDRVFGGGLVVGSLILLGGEPGIGKSTLVAQISGSLAEKIKTIYVSGEESLSQVKLRFDRLNQVTDELKFISETNVKSIKEAIIKSEAKLVIVDSIQTMIHEDVPTESGSVSQIKASAAIFLELAKKHNITIIIIGHITKDGNIAGPKSLEHIVDTVVYLEADPSNNFRFLRTTKNRFGSTNELGIFEMTSKGLIEIKNPSSIFLEEGHESISGTVVSSVVEGTRAFLVEIQALVTKTNFGYPQRRASGFDLSRLQVLTAVLSKRTKINLATFDVILNVAGGLKLNDPGVDLAVVAAIISSYSNKPINKQSIILGEVGLGGEIRSVSRIDERLKEAKKLGFNEAIIPLTSKTKESQLKIKSIKNINELTNIN